MKALFVAAHDSQLKWAAAASKPFRDNGWSIIFFAPQEHANISTAQMIDAGVDPSEVIFGDGLSHVGFWATHDVVFFLPPGSITERYIYALRKRIAEDPIRRPIIVSAYVGMVIENHIGGYVSRAASDLICVNSSYDYEIYASAAKDLGICTLNLVVTGLSFIGAATIPRKTGPITNVVFADQLVVPKKISDRRIIYQNLLEYAWKHPSRSVLVKPRHRPNEGSVHKKRYAPEEFFSSRTLPNNLKVDYTPISELLPTTDLLLTVSSTAALEAIAQGARAAIIADVGVGEGHGNHIFIGSGLLRTFDQIAADDIGSPDPQWLLNFQHHGTEPAQAIYKAVCQKVAERPPLIRAPILAARERVINDPWGFAEVSQPKAKVASRLRKAIKAWIPPIAVNPARRVARKLGVT